LGGPCVSLKQHATLPGPSGSNTHSSECNEAELREGNTIPIDSGSLFSNSLPLLNLFGARERKLEIALGQSPSSEKVPTSRIYKHGGSLIHRSA
jgi:hypothetical protein